MPTPNAVRKSIQDRFKAVWLTETVYDFDNIEFTQPIKAKWIRLVVRTKLRAITTMGVAGNRKFSSDAAVVAQVFVPVETGTSENDRLSKKLADIFDGVRFDGLAFEAAIVREIGVSGKFFQYNVECSFSYEDIK